MANQSAVSEASRFPAETSLVKGPHGITLQVRDILMDDVARMRRVWLFALFLYGSAMHLLFILWEFHALPGTTFVNNLIRNLGTAIIGGGCVVLLFRRLLREQSAVEGDEPHLSVIKGGFFGILASLLALESILASCALIVTIYSFYKVGGGAQSVISGFLPMLGLMWLSIHTYMFSLFPHVVPFGLIYGAVAGFVISKRRARTFPIHI